MEWTGVSFSLLAILQAAQVTLVAAVATLLVALFARNRPHLAHALWLVVLVKCVTPPIWSSPTSVFSWWPMQVSDVSQVAKTTHPLPTTVTVTPQSIPTLPILKPVPTTAPVYYAEPAVAVPHIRWPTIIAFGWLGIAGFVVVVAVVRLGLCVRRIRKTRQSTPGDLEALIVDLSSRLGLKRGVRVCVTTSDVGPAVIGWLRPMLVLPAVIVRSRSVTELAPIIAHELIHVRRRDLWVGWVQVVAQAAWWFHPVIWLVNRMLSREAERCCDEETIAETNCSPATYARCLLDVLELKRNLSPVPTVPGVKPVEITRKRMERIMQLGNTGYKRTPWWCRVVLVAGIALLVPGAAFLAAETEPPVNETEILAPHPIEEAIPPKSPESDPFDKDKPATKREPRPPKDSDRFSSDKPLSSAKDKQKNETLVKLVYPVADLIIPMPAAGKNDAIRADSKPLIDLIMKTIQPDSWKSNGGKGEIEHLDSTLSLTVNQTLAIHEKVAELIAKLRQLNDTQVALRCQMIRVDRTTAKKFFVHYRLDKDFLGTDATGQALVASSAAQGLPDYIEKREKVVLQPAINATFLDGQAGEINVSLLDGDKDVSSKLQLAASIAPHRRFVRLTLALNAGNALDALSKSRSKEISNGLTWMIDVTGELNAQAASENTDPASKAFRRLQQQAGVESDDMVLLLITPQILPEGEQETFEAAKSVR